MHYVYIKREKKKSQPKNSWISFLKRTEHIDINNTWCDHCWISSFLYLPQIVWSESSLTFFLPPPRAFPANLWPWSVHIYSWTNNHLVSKYYFYHSKLPFIQVLCFFTAAPVVQHLAVFQHLAPPLARNTVITS